MKFFLLGILLFKLTYLQIVGSESICAEEAYREDCGYYGIDEEECEEKGCCWSPLENNAWCFYKTDIACVVDEKEREDCGYYGIKEKECEDKGCCWGPTETAGIPWCFSKVEVTIEPPVEITTTQQPTEVPTTPSEVTEAPTTAGEVTEAPTTAGEVTEAPTEPEENVKGGDKKARAKKGRRGRNHYKF